jgi:hypothetical protein
MSFAVVSSLYPHTRINRTRGEHHDRYLHLRRLFQPSMATAPTAAAGAATGASKALSCSTTASPCTASSSGWSSGPRRIGEEHAGNGGVDHTGRTPRLAGRDRRER